MLETLRIFFPRRFFCSDGGCMGSQKDTFDQIGGFDENLARSFLDRLLHEASGKWLQGRL